jgi:UDP-N-acetylmuramate--alanine ligase
MDNAEFLTESDIPDALKLPLPGAHWRQNASLAVAAAMRLGADSASAVAALVDFPGVNRRFTVRGTTADGHGVVIDDYAHHPTELRATLSALAEGYPDHALLVVFQPHRFERVKRYGAQFAELLGQVSRAWVVAPFAAWVADGDGINPSDIVTAIPGGRGVYMENDPEAIATSVLGYASALSGRYVVAVIGAGDVLPITERILDTRKKQKL